MKDGIANADQDGVRAWRSIGKLVRFSARFLSVLLLLAFGGLEAIDRHLAHRFAGKMDFPVSRELSLVARDRGDVWVESSPGDVRGRGLMLHNGARFQQEFVIQLGHNFAGAPHVVAAHQGEVRDLFSHNEGLGRVRPGIIDLHSVRVPRKTRVMIWLQEQRAEGALGTATQTSVETGQQEVGSLDVMAPGERDLSVLIVFILETIVGFTFGLLHGLSRGVVQWLKSLWTPEGNEVDTQQLRPSE